MGSTIGDAPSAAVPGDDDVRGMGPDLVILADAAPVCNGALGYRPLRLSAKGTVRSRASDSRTIDSTVGDAPSAAVLEDDDVPGMGPDLVVVANAAPVCDGALGDRPLGLLAEGTVRLRASDGGTIGWTIGDAPLALVAPTGLPVRRRTLPGDDISVTDPNDAVGAGAAFVCNGALHDRPVGFLAEGGICPPASPVRPNGLADRSDAPPPVTLNVSQAADGHRPTEGAAGTTNAGSLGANGAPMRQSTGLYPLFNGRNAGRVR